MINNFTPSSLLYYSPSPHSPSTSSRTTRSLHRGYLADFDLADSGRGVFECFQNLGVDVGTAHPSAALLLSRSLQPYVDPQLLADVLNLCVDLGDLGLVSLPFNHHGREIVAGDEGQPGLNFALLVFNDFVDLAHGVVVSILKYGSQTAENSVEVNFQLLIFAAAAKEFEKAAPHWRTAPSV